MPKNNMPKCRKCSVILNGTGEKYEIAGSILYMADTENEKQNLTMAEISPERLLKGETPRLSDEW